jgi:glutaredoxin-related protein
VVSTFHSFLCTCIAPSIRAQKSSELAYQETSAPPFLRALKVFLRVRASAASFSDDPISRSPGPLLGSK